MPLRPKYIMSPSARRSTNLLLRLTLIALCLSGLLVASPAQAHLSARDENAIATPQVTPPDAIKARAALLIDGTTGEVLYARNPNDRHLPASTVKLMTALIAFEKSGFNGEVTITGDDTRVERSWIPVIPGETIPLKTLFYALLLHSANDAARALARYTAGSTDDFIDLMNQRAAAMGMNNTHYANPNGLPASDQYTSCADLMKVFRAVVSHPELRKICSTKAYHLDTRAGYQLVKNHNLLLGTYPGMGPAKTGWTEASRHTYAAEACRDGHVLQLTLLDTPDKWGDAIILFNWGFATDTGTPKQTSLQTDPNQVNATPPIPLPSSKSVTAPVDPPSVTTVPVIQTKKITLKDGRVFNVRNYTVNPGDTLSSLSQTYGCSISDLAAINVLPRRSQIFAGQELLVPAN